MKLEDPEQLNHHSAWAPGIQVILLCLGGGGVLTPFLSSSTYFTEGEPTLNFETNFFAFSNHGYLWDRLVSDLREKL